jgi:Fur family ferric uptake transcriptional regulator
MKQRSTRQLAATLVVLAASTDHPTAEQVFKRVRRRVPRVSLGTVYRNLDKLHEQGMLQVVWLAGGVAHYDAVTTQHDHFVCEGCGVVRDIEPLPGLTSLTGLGSEGFVVHRQMAALYGLCPACAQRDRPPAAIQRRGAPQPPRARRRTARSPA